MASPPRFRAICSIFLLLVLSRVSDGVDPDPMALIEEASCTFDVGICPNFSQRGNYVWRKRLSNYGEISPLNGSGGYLYVDSQQAQANSGRYAELRTAPINVPSVDTNITHQIVTVKFYYRFGTGSTKLEVRHQQMAMDSLLVQQPIWQTTQSLTPEMLPGDWQAVVVSFCQPADQGVALAFRVTPGANFTLATLDELTTSYDLASALSCEDSYVALPASCGFEDDTCGWINEENDQLNFRRVIGSEASEGSAYLRTEAISSTPNGAVATLVSRKLSDNSTSPFYLSFFYRLRSLDSRLTLSVRTAGAENRELWSENSVDVGTANDWRQVAVQLCDVADAQLIFSANRGDVSLDNINLADNGSVITDCPLASPLTCNFEKSFCGWTSNLDSEFRFKRALGSVSEAVENSISATEGSGFVFAAANDRFSESRIPAILHTVRFHQLRNAAIFTFWYHTRGYGVRHLELDMTRILPNYNETEVLWKKEAGDEFNWQQARVTLCSTSAFMLSFNASFSMPDHFIALDSLVLENEASLSGALPPASYECPDKDLRTISCDFVEGDCGWTNEDPEFEWQIVNVTTSVAPASQYDITTAASGSSFAVARANDRPAAGVHFARFVSRPVSRRMPNNTKLEFWYHMKGSGIDYLHVLIRDVYKDSNLTVWERTGSQGPQWKKASFTVCLSVGSQIIFEADFFLPSYVIGLDNIVYLGENDAGSAEPGQCPLVSCTFERDNCGWSHHVPDFEWESAEDSLAPGGRFSFSTWFYGDVAARATTSCLTINDESDLSFWYYTSSTMSTRLRLLMQDMNETKPAEVLWQSGQDDTAYEWSFQTVTLHPVSSVQLTLEALSLDKSSQSAAVDTITLTNEAEILTSCNPVVPIANPKANVTCDFEDNDPCGWNVAGSNGWQLGQGVVGMEPYQLNGTEFGAGFLYIDSNRLPSLGQSDELESRVTNGAQTELTFYYRAYGSGIGSLVLFADQAGTKYQLWSGHNAGRAWSKESVNLCFSNSFKLIFEARFLSRGFVIGLDDVVLDSEQTNDVTPGINCTQLPPYTTVAPPTTRPTITVPTTISPSSAPVLLPPSFHGSGEFDCGFEQATLCEWKNLELSDNNSLYWTPTKSLIGNTSTVNMNATDGSYYAVAVSLPGSVLHTARLISPSVDYVRGSNETIRFQFYYRASGRGSNGISILAVNSDYLPTKAIWSTGIGNLERWNLAKVEIPLPFTLRRQIILQTRFIQRNTWVALDEIKLGWNDAPAPTAAVTTSIIPVTASWGSQTLSCSFDRIFCGWQAAGFTLAPVNVTNQGTPSLSDANFASVSTGTQGKQANLTSPVHHLTTRTQATFHYYITSAVQSLAVYADQNSYLKPLWQLVVSDQVPMEEWLPARISLCLTGSFRLVLDVKLSSSNESAVGFGLDNLVINNELTALTTIPSGFTCSPLPVPTASVSCNSDSASASSSSSAYCGWRPSNESTNTIFNVNTSLTGAIEQGHSGGVFLYILPATIGLVVDSNIQSPRVRRANNDKVAVIESITIPDSTSEGILTFWYQQKGCRWHLEGSIFNESLMVSGGETTTWTPASVQVQPHDFVATESFKLLFRVVFNDSTEDGDSDTIPSRYFALDDVWLTTEPGFTPDLQIDTPETTLSTSPATSTASSVSSESTVSTSPPMSSIGSTPDLQTHTPETTLSTSSATPTVSSVPSGSTVTTYRPATDAGQPPRPTKGPRTVEVQEDVVIGVSTVAGLLVTAALMLIIYHLKTKRQWKKKARMEYEAATALKTITRPPSTGV